MSKHITRLQKNKYKLILKTATTKFCSVLFMCDVFFLSSPFFLLLLIHKIWRMVLYENVVCLANRTKHIDHVFFLIILSYEWRCVYECVWTVGKNVYKIYDSESHSLKFLKKTKTKTPKDTNNNNSNIKIIITMKIELWGRIFLNRKIQENV